MKLSVIGLGAIGPGYSDWDGLSTHLKNHDAPVVDTLPPAPQCMSKRERARAPNLVRLAIAAAEQACEMSSSILGDMASVFASSMSDTEVTDYMCRVLTEDPSQMSPTRFHNSVHNAAVGYWAISNSIHKPATAIAAGDYTAGVALAEAAAQCDQEGIEVLLVVYEIATPKVFKCIADISQATAFAMVLAPDTDHAKSIASLDIDFNAQLDSSETSLNVSDKSLLSSYTENPVAEILPLFERLNNKTPSVFSLKTSAERSILISIN